MGTGRRSRWERGVLAMGLGGSILAGVMAATGQAPLALAVTGLLAIGRVVAGERRRVAVLLWGTVAFTAPFNGVRVTSFLAVSDVVLVAALSASLPEIVRTSRRRLVPLALPAAFGIVISAGIVGTFFAQNVTASLTISAKVVLAAAGSVAAMALWDPGVPRLRQFAWMWLAGATVSAGVALLTPPSFGDRSLGLTTHPNHFGLVCVLAVGLGVGLGLSSTGRTRMAAFAAVGLLVAGVGVSGSRSAVLGLAVTIPVAALLTRRTRLLVATGVAVLLLGMAVVVGIIHVPESNAISRLGGGGGSVESDAERQQLLAEALDTIARHPFTGEGFEFAQAAHSIYLQALVVGGPAALAGFLWICWTIARVGRRGSRPASAGDGAGNHLVVAGLTAGFAGYLSSNAFDNILWDRYLWTYLGLLLVLAGTMRHDAELVAHQASPRSPVPPAPANDHSRRAGAAPAISGAGSWERPE